MTTLTIAEPAVITYTIEINPVEFQEVEQSPLDDSGTERELVGELGPYTDPDDVLAWCHLVVTATCGLFTGRSSWFSDYRYKSQEDFMKCDDYKLMQEESREDLLRILKEASDLYNRIAAGHEQS